MSPLGGQVGDRSSTMKHSVTISVRGKCIYRDQGIMTKSERHFVTAGFFCFLCSKQFLRQALEVLSIPWKVSTVYDFGFWMQIIEIVAFQPSEIIHNRSSHNIR